MFFQHVFRLIRPEQYVKNLFIFTPIFFAAKITQWSLLFDVFIVFIAFSLVASSVYVLNDLMDIEDDKNHPIKKYRPLASGMIKKHHAILCMLLLFIFGGTLMGIHAIHTIPFLLGYVVLNIAYSVYLKHVAILDVSSIAIGFVLRLFIGSTVTNIELSIWMIIMTFLLSLFMALAKRRDDVIIYLDTGKKMRKAMQGYNLQMLDISMAIMASVVIVSYILYTISSELMLKTHGEYLYLTTFFVIMGVMRYLQISFVFQDSGSPTKIILKDSFMQLNIVCWILVFIWIIYS